MVNTSLELNINTLKNYTIMMMEKCEQSVAKSIEALVKRDLELAKEVINNDDEIDILREYIRDRSIELTVLKQPMAKDLRYIYALGSIAIELERIGDYSVNIANEQVKIGNEQYIKELVDIPKMADICRQMILDAKVALEENDEQLAYDVALIDDKVDKLYECIHKDCINIMNKDSNTIEQGVKLMFIGRYLERIGDHTTNVCEKIIYAIKGEMVEIG